MDTYRIEVTPDDYSTRAGCVFCHSAFEVGPLAFNLYANDELVGKICDECASSGAAGAAKRTREHAADLLENAADIEKMPPEVFPMQDAIAAAEQLRRVEHEAETSTDAHAGELGAEDDLFEKLLIAENTAGELASGYESIAWDSWKRGDQAEAQEREAKAKRYLEICNALHQLRPDWSKAENAPPAG